MVMVQCLKEKCEHSWNYNGNAKYFQYISCSMCYNKRKFGDMADKAAFKNNLNNNYPDYQCDTIDKEKSNNKLNSYYPDFSKKEHENDMVDKKKSEYHQQKEEIKEFIKDYLDIRLSARGILIEEALQEVRGEIKVEECAKMKRGVEYDTTKEELSEDDKLEKLKKDEDKFWQEEEKKTYE
jgi:hypothetical protein